MNLEKLVKFEVREDLDDWEALERLLRSEAYFSEYEKNEKPLLQEFGQFLKDNRVRRIIDFHTISFKYEHFNVKRFVEGRLYPVLHVTSIPNFPLNMARWIAREIYSHGVGLPFKLVVFGLPIYHTDVRLQNQYILRSSAAVGACPFALTPPDFTKNELEDLVKSGFRGFKPYYLLKDLNFGSQGEFGTKFPLMEVKDWLTDDLLEVADEHGLPIMLHIAPSINEKGKPNDAVYGDVRKRIRKYQNARFILTHLGLCHTPELFGNFMDRYKSCGNVLLEASTIQNPEVLEYAFKVFDKSQLLYGSDLPFSLIRQKVVVMTPEIAECFPTPELRSLFIKKAGLPFTLTKGDYLFNRLEVMKAFKEAAIKHMGGEPEYMIALAEEFLAKRYACERLVEQGFFTVRELPEFLNSFFHGNAENLLKRRR